LRLLLLSGLTGPVQAHDPGLSTAEVRLQASAVTVRLSLSRYDLDSLLLGPSTSKVGSGLGGSLTSKLETFAADAVELLDPPRPLAARRVELRQPSAEEIQLELEYPRPPGTLRLEFPLLSKLSRGHRLLVSVRESTDDRPERRLLDGSAYWISLAGGAGVGFWPWIKETLIYRRE
jgi:hypothetical protein